ncbi:helix-turn-helix domain-containing protein [Deinococcus fonticola]|uniref:helix-turn-helix domain-containing protein n=1 Tax=Deinococcus fonticola TaxID=2528713 RepID=UPI001074CD2F|nr:helix-turn-helix domain-containing protein [Deinococcus fonticola]
MSVSDLPAALTIEELPGLLASLRQAVSRPQPEQALATFLVRLTGGFVEIRASWGDVVASAGRPVGETQQFKLTHAGRHVGRLTVSFPPDWNPMTPVVVEYALLARLQSAAAGASRRRVGERTLEALLQGHSDPFTVGGESFAVALASFEDEPGRGASAQAAHAHALDVLAGVGEGYFAERNLGGFCTVRGSQAIWLWSTHDLKLETNELFAALTASTGRRVKLGVSAAHQRPDFKNALEEAAQSLSSLREAGVVTFMEVDTLYELLQSDALNGLRAQVKAQLASVDPDGKVEAALRAYLAHSGTLEELASRLRVHVNTLRYRLKLAERAMKGSLNEPATMSRLFLALGPSRPSQEQTEAFHRSSEGQI